VCVYGCGYVCGVKEVWLTLCVFVPCPLPCSTIMEALSLPESSIIKPLFEDTSSDDDDILFDLNKNSINDNNRNNSFVCRRPTPMELRDQPKRVVLNFPAQGDDKVFNFDGENTCPKWKRYEAHTGWKNISLVPGLPVSTGYGTKCKFSKPGKSSNLKAKTSRSLRILSNSPYDVSCGARSAWKSNSPIRGNGAGSISILDRYPPREQYNVNDAIDALDTMKITKKIGFSTSIEIMK
jgi:hypothetical protein